MKKRERLNRKALAMTLVLVLIISLVSGNVFAQTHNIMETEGVAFTVGEAGYWMGDTWIESDATPYIQADRIMVPVAHASRALGAEVLWKAETKEVEVKHHEDTYTLTIGSTQLQKNGEQLEEMDTIPVIQNIGNGLGRTMLPVSRLAKVLNVAYTWDADTKTATFMPMAEEGPVVYDEAGTYGPEEDTETIDNDVIISADGVILQNMVITGNLTITEDVGDGDVTLNNITVESDTLVQGGGTDSIHINGGRYNNIIVQRTPSGALRIVVTGQNRLNIEVDEEADEQILILDGIYDKVIVTAPNVRIITRGETQINELIITDGASNTTLETSEDTTIEKAVVDGEGTVFEGGEGTVKELEGVNEPEDKDDVVVQPPASSGGGGGGGSSQPSTPPVVPPSDFAGGEGTEASPYQVATAQHLDNVRNHLDKHFIQIADINLGESPWNTGEGWDPIGEWNAGLAGSFDGNGFSINNLTIDYDGTDSYRSLFQELSQSGLIKNVALTSVEVTGNSFVSALVAYQRGGEIINCSVSGTIKANNNVGGLVAQSEGLISKCYSAGSVESLNANGNNYYFGGLVGRTANSAELLDSYSTADVIGDMTVGGLVGNAWGVSISDCYSTGRVSGTGNAGGLVGQISNINNVINSYWDTESSEQASSAGGTGYVTSAMIKETNDVSIYVDWDFENIWTMQEGQSYPYLKWQNDTNIPYPPSPFAGGVGTVGDPYKVATAEQLNEVRNYPDSHFIQIDNIDLGVSPWNVEDGWEPVGTESSPFKGEYDGDEYSIEGLYINKPTERYQGLFGNINAESKLININLVDSYVYGYRYTGTLAGYSAGEISNCSSVNVEVLNEWDYAGGLVGHNTGVISDSHTTGIVKIDDYNAGGLVGTNSNEIINCYSEADLSPIAVAADGYPYQMGGLVGYNSGGTIENSHAKGYVTGWETIGGLVGENYDGSVVNSYAEGNASGDEEYIGGLVGTNGHNSTISNSYAIGTVSGDYYVGGLVGYNSSLVENSYHKTGTVTGLEKIGGLVGDNNGTITESYSDSTVSGNQYLGGLAGYSSGGEIEFSYATGNVSAIADTREAVGGLVGSAQSTDIHDCYAIGTVSGGSEVGGLVGYLSIGSSVANCYATGQVSGSSSVGGLIGSKADSGTVPTVDNSYYDSQTTNQSDNSGKGIPKTTAEMKTLLTFIGWDFSEIWGINPDENNGYPFLRWQGFDHIEPLSVGSEQTVTEQVYEEDEISMNFNFSGALVDFSNSMNESKSDDPIDAIQIDVTSLPAILVQHKKLI